MTFGLSAESWTSSDGKTIEAEFVRVKDGSVVLNADGKEYSVPLERLDRKSRDYATFIQEKMKELAVSNMALPVIAESALLDAMGCAPDLAEGKAFLMEALVKSISKSSSLGASPRTTAAIVLGEGTRMEMDISGEGDGKRTKAKVEEGRIVLLKGTNYSDGKYRDFEEDVALAEKGRAAVFNVRVEDQKIIGTGLASEEEIIRAKVERAPRPVELTAEQKAEIGRMEVRIAYLKSQLDDGPSDSDGGILSTKSVHSDSDRKEMETELKGLKRKIEEMTRNTIRGRSRTRP